MLITTTIFSSILFFVLMQIRNKYKNKNSTKNSLLWALLFGILNYIILITCKFRHGIEEGLALSIPFPPVYDIDSQAFSTSVKVKDVTGYISAKFDPVNKMYAVNVDDALLGSIMPQGITGAPGAPGLTGANGEKGSQGNTGNKGDPGLTGEIGPQGERGVQGERGKWLNSTLSM
jgi:hypothetical protein